MLLGLALAAGPTFDELVAYDIDPLWVRMPPEALEAARTARCDAGDADACAWANGTPLLDVLHARCADAPEECIAVAWALELDQPTEAVRRYRALCADGHARACADLARAHLDGIGTWTSALRARRIAARACEDHPAACHVLARIEAPRHPTEARAHAERALAGGWTASLGLLAELGPPASRTAALATACDAGLGEACARHAEALWTDPEGRAEAAEALEQACQLRHIDACVTAVVASVATGARSSADGARALEPWCATDPQACLERDFLTGGGEVTPFKRKERQEGRGHYIVETKVPFILDCFRDVLSEVPDYDGATMELVAWLDAEGTVRGATAPDSPVSFRHCIADALVGAPFYPMESPLQVTMPLPMEHHAVLTVSSRAGSYSTQHAGVAIARRDWPREAEACFVHNGGTPYDQVQHFQSIKVSRKGEVTPGKVLDSTGLDGVDACITDMLTGDTLGQTFSYPGKIELTFHFGIVGIDR